jgi:hypothetical protein
MTDNKWKELTFELVFKSKYIGSGDNYYKKRAEELLHNGLVSKSFNKLQQQGQQTKLDINDEVIRKMKQLNPQRQVPFQQHWLQNRMETPLIDEITSAQVENAINKLDGETNPGLLKFRSVHIQDLIGSKGGARNGQEFLKEYTKLVNLIAKGNILPSTYHQFIGSCQGMPLPKGESNIRPIAIPHLTRKITEKCIASKFAIQFERHFHGLQFGVATPGGSEKLIHGIMDQQLADPTQDIILLDSENAFNNLNRDSIFMEIEEFFPVCSKHLQSTHLYLRSSRQWNRQFH